MARKKKPPKKRPRAEEPVLKGAGFKKQDIAQKLIPLSVLSGKEAERAVDNVLAAITHVLGEGDLLIPDFGRFKASKSPKTGYIRISFTASGKLKQAVEARLHATPSPDPDAGTESSPQIDPGAGSFSGSQSSSPSTPTLEPSPTPPSLPAPDTDTALPASSGEVPDSPAVGSYVQSAGAYEPSPAQEATETCESGGSCTPAESEQPTNGVNDQGSLEPDVAHESGGEPSSDDCTPSRSSESSEILVIDSVSVEERGLIANGQDYKLAENLTILDVNGNTMNFADQVAALQHLSLVSRIIVISKTLLRVGAESNAISIITTLQILQYRG